MEIIPYKVEHIKGMKTEYQIYIQQRWHDMTGNIFVSKQPKRQRHVFFSVADMHLNITHLYRKLQSNDLKTTVSRKYASLDTP
jgi:hypothetical protein